MAAQTPYKIQDIAQNVNKRTENRAGTKMDLRMELFLAIDEFCLDRHWWWANKRFIIPATIGTGAYDLSGVASDFSEFDELFLIDPSGKLIQGKLTPLFDSQAQLTAILNTTPSLPSTYFIDTNATFQAMQLGAPSSVAQNLMGKYWAMPMITLAQDDIPLIPPFLHWGLVHALERRVFKFLYGVGDVRASTAETDYQNFKLIASRRPTWSDKKVSSVAVTGRAVQSH